VDRDKWPAMRRAVAVASGAFTAEFQVSKRGQHEQTWIVRAKAAVLTVVARMINAALWDGYLDSDEVADALGMNNRSLRGLCNQGRVPYARQRHDGRWMLRPQSVEFLRQYPQLTGAAGQRCAVAMRRQAARRDRKCRLLQREWAAAHPEGSYPVAKQRKRPGMKYTDAPLELRKVWEEITEARSLHEKVLLLCRKLGKQAGDGESFVLLTADVARLLGVSRDTAGRIMQNLETGGRIKMTGFQVTLTQHGRSGIIRGKQ